MRNDPEPFFRPFRTEDTASLTRHADNINIWSNTRDYLPHPYTLADAEKFIAYCTARETPADFAVIADGQAVGAIGYIPLPDVQRVSAEIGYWLGEEYWGRGIMSQVLTDFTEYLFGNTGIIHLYANVFEGNAASMRVLEKAGFRPVGVMHRAAVKNGRIIDLHYYEKLKPWGGSK